MKKIKWLFVALFVFSSIAFAQEKLLTIDDIFDPQKRIAFNGRPTFGVRWLVDGTSYFQMQPSAAGGQMGFYRVDAKTGNSTLFYDASKLKAALVVAGLKADDANQYCRSDGF